MSFPSYIFCALFYSCRTCNYSPLSTSCPTRSFCGMNSPFLIGNISPPSNQQLTKQTLTCDHTHTRTHAHTPHTLTHSHTYNTLSDMTFLPLPAHHGPVFGGGGEVEARALLYAGRSAHVLCCLLVLLANNCLASCPSTRWNGRALAWLIILCIHVFPLLHPDPWLPRPPPPLPYPKSYPLFLHAYRLF